MLCRLAVPLKPNTVVDAGCGEGYYLNTLREALPQAELLGLDISKEAVRCAAGRYKSITWLTATAADMPPLRGKRRSFALPLRPYGAGGISPGAGAGGTFSPGLGRRRPPPRPQIHHLPGAFPQGEDFPPGFAGIHPPKNRNFGIYLHPGGAPDGGESSLYDAPRLPNQPGGLERLRATPRLTDTAQVIFNLYCKE